MFYLVVFLILALFGLLEITDIHGVYKRILLMVSILIMWFIASLKYEVGGDWPTYTQFFIDIEPLGEVFSGNAPLYHSSYMEPGYKLLNSAVKSIGGNMQWIFFFVGSINAVLFYTSLRKYCVYPILGILIYYCSIYFPLDLIAIRQAVAVQLFFLSLFYVHGRRFWPFFWILLLAFLFHRSAVLLFPLYWMINRPYSLKFYHIIFFGSASVFFLQIHWMTGLLNLAADIIGGVNGGVIKMYVSSTTYGANRVLSVGVLINFILYFLLIYNRQKLQVFKYYTVFFNLFIINLVVFFVFYEFMEISIRYRFYFLLGNVVLLPYLIVIYKDKALKFVAYLGIISFSFLYGRAVFLEDSTAIAFNPYQNYLIHLIFDTKSDGLERLKKSDAEYIESRKR